MTTAILGEKNKFLGGDGKDTWLGKNTVMKANTAASSGGYASYTAG